MTAGASHVSMLCSSTATGEAAALAVVVVSALDQSAMRLLGPLDGRPTGTV